MGLSPTRRVSRVEGFDLVRCEVEVAAVPVVQVARRVVLEHHGHVGTPVDVQGARRQVNIGMLDEPPSAGDWVLLHLGFAVEAIDEGQAREALAGLELMGQPLDTEEPRG